MRLNVRSKVVLPEPVGPMSAVTAPRLTSTEMPDRTARWPKLSVRSTALRAIGPPENPGWLKVTDWPAGLMFAPVASPD